MDWASIGGYIVAAVMGGSAEWQRRKAAARKLAIEAADQAAEAAINRLAAEAMEAAEEIEKMIARSIQLPGGITVLAELTAKRKIAIEAGKALALRRYYDTVHPPKPLKGAPKGTPPEGI